MKGVDNQPLFSLVYCRDTCKKQQASRQYIFGSMRMVRMSVDVGGTKLLVKIVGDELDVLREFTTGSDFDGTALEAALLQLENEFDLHEYDIALALPSLIRDDVVVECDVIPGLVGFNKTQLRVRGRVRVMMNDLDAAMYSVAHPDNKCELLIMSGTGIGMSIAMNGKIFRGGKGFAGELGYCMVPAGGDSVVDLDVFCAGHVLHREKRTSPTEMAKAGRMMGLAVSWVINIFDPNRVVLAGGMMNNPDYLAGCKQGISEFTLITLLEGCVIEVPDNMKTIVCDGGIRALSILDNGGTL